MSIRWKYRASPMHTLLSVKAITDYRETQREQKYNIIWVSCQLSNCPRCRSTYNKQDDKMVSPRLRHVVHLLNDLNLGTGKRLSILGTESENLNM